MKRVEERLVLKKSIKVFLNKLLVTIIIFLCGMIYIKDNPKNKIKLKENIYENSIKFTKTKKIYEKYFGKLLSVDKVVKKTTPVFKEKLSYNKIEKYKDGIKLNVIENYMIPTLESGVIVYLGEKEGYGKTVIIEQVNGIDTIYSNINIKNKKLYDYMEKGELLGESIGDYFYLIFEKEGEYLNYKEYI